MDANKMPNYLVRPSKHREEQAYPASLHCHLTDCL